ncbi:MAG: single-stranded-DNA-specific exonuclease RecJ [Clostridia bacterium]|nr:single-stranded-DNA-specific exonuclease RecJ [Clostridia bacterium]
MNSKGLKKEKKWILKSSESPEAVKSKRKIAEELGINPIVADLLYTRGFETPEAAKRFLYMESEMLCNPFDMADMEKGVLRVKKAIDNGEKITIYGDYDVDGVTSVCTLYLYLKSKGADVSYYIPNRAGEGYGVSAPAIDALKDSGTTLIITVDTGITAIEEVEYAKSVDVDFLITDHHECHGDIPAATAVINPHRPDCAYPFKELAGVGVVFKFVTAYEERIGHCSRMQAAVRIFAEYADLVAIGTIADVMPIRNENRIIVSYGLKMIESTKRLGLIALMEAAAGKNEQSARSDKRRKRTKITTGYIGYTLAPKINAAGRIRSAELAVELFLSNNSRDASRIAEELCSANKERQNEENKIMQEAYLKIDSENMADDPVIVLDADGWHHGVIGIVASRITEKYSRPTILVSFETASGEPCDSDIGKGSGRSIKGMNLVEALCYCDDLLVKFGGHELAAGLSVTRGNLKAFRKKINEYAMNNLDKDAMIPTVEADCEVSLSDISLRLAEELQILEPYGVGNPIPNFMMHGVHVNEISGVSDNKHTRFSFGQDRQTVSAMFFSTSPASLGIYNGDKVDLIFNIDINEYLGRRSVQLFVKDIKPTENQDIKNEAEHRRFEEIWNGAHYTRDEKILPSREDFAAVYRYIVASVRSGNDVIAHRDICYNLSHGHEPHEIGYIKLKIIIKVFQELNLVGIEEIAEEIYRFKVQYSTSKTDLEKSSLLRRIRSQMDFK